jgi:hypothetical protein
MMPGSRIYWQDWLWKLADGDVGYAIAALLMLYQPSFMDILPQYVIYLVFAPPLVWLCLTGRWTWVVAGSLFLWVLVQFGFHLPLVDAIDGAMRSASEGLTLRAHFNVLAWQLLFMGGLVLGALVATDQVDWQRVFDPERRAPAVLAGLLLLLFMGLRLASTWGYLPEAFAERFARYDIRGEFSLVYLLNFAALAYLVAWFMIAGVRSKGVIPRRIGLGLMSLFTLPFLRLIGRHSLQVYVWHVVLVYLVKAFDYHYGPFSEASKTLIAVMAVASLAVPALWRERKTLTAPVTRATG